MAMPPVPVLVPTPAPVRLNQSSTVNWRRSKTRDAPNVTYWLLPFSWIAEFVTTSGVAVTSFEEADLFPALSTAVTT